MIWVTEKRYLQGGIYDMGHREEILTMGYLRHGSQRRGTYNGVSMTWVTEKRYLQGGIYDMGHREEILTRGYL